MTSIYSGIRDLADLVEFMEQNTDLVNGDSMNTLEIFGKGCYLGRINLENNGREKVLWQWDGESTPYDATFVTPAFDAKLAELIVKRAKAPYTGTQGDKELLDPIMDRVLEIDGRFLWWA